MAILTKEQFEKRRENAAKRNAENTNIAVENGLPREIGETLEGFVIGGIGCIAWPLKAFIIQNPAITANFIILSKKNMTKS